MTRTSTPLATPRAATRSAWSVRTLRDDDAFRRLGPEWDELFRRSPQATPFLSRPWLDAWWRAYGAPGTLRLVVVRRHGRLVAAAPLMARPRFGVVVWSFVGTGVSDFLDILVDSGADEDPLPMLRRALFGLREWQVLDLGEVRAGGHAQLLHATWPAARWRLPDSPCFELHDADLGALLARMPRKTAGKVRTKLRRIDDHGITARTTPAAEAAETLCTLLRLHEAQWSDRGIDPEHARPRFRRLLVEAVPELVALGAAELVRYERGGEVVACDLLMVGADLVGGYLYGVDPDVGRSVDVSALMVRQAMGVRQSRNRPVFSLMRGVEDAKRRWRPTRADNDRLLFGRPGGVAAHAYAFAVHGRREVVEAARTRLPAEQWQRLRRVRSGSARLAEAVGMLRPGAAR